VQAEGAKKKKVKKVEVTAVTGLGIDFLSVLCPLPAPYAWCRCLQAEGAKEEEGEEGGGAHPGATHGGAPPRSCQKLVELEYEMALQVRILIPDRIESAHCSLDGDRSASVTCF